MPQMHPIYWLVMAVGVGSLLYVVSATSWSNLVGGVSPCEGNIPPEYTEKWVLI